VDVLPVDLDLRNATYRLFVGLGRAPTAAEAADATGATVGGVLDGWVRLHAGNASAAARADASTWSTDASGARPTTSSVAGLRTP